jgi:ABC-type transport system involved in multi-copper enzyme maturation permease subunit
MLNIALNTFKEIVRNKFLYLIVVFWFLFIIFSLSLWRLTIWEDNKIIVDFGISMIEIFWLISVVFVWSQLLFKEIEGKTIFLILSKPIKRYEFIIWKFFWLSLVISLIVILESILYLFVLYFKWISIDYLIIFSLIFILLKLLTLVSIVLFLSTFMSTILTIMASIMIYFVSHSFSLLIDLVLKIKSESSLILARWLQLLFPPFEALNIKDYIWSIIKLDYTYFLFNLFYSIIYIIILLLLSIVIFNRKSFEK